MVCYEIMNYELESKEMKIKQTGSRMKQNKEKIESKNEKFEGLGKQKQEPLLLSIARLRFGLFGWSC